MPVLQNTTHEKFAQLRAAGRRPLEAFLEANPKAQKWTRNAAKVRASNWGARPDVAARIRELATVSASAVVASRQEVAEWLTRVLRTPIGEVDEKSVLAQEKTTRIDGGGAVVEKVRVPDKLGAAVALVKMLDDDRKAAGGDPDGDGAARFEADEGVLAALKDSLARALGKVAKAIKEG